MYLSSTMKWESSRCGGYKSIQEIKRHVSGGV